MKTTDYLLLCLAEECAEIQQLCSKAMRFGLDSHNPDDPERRKNIDKLKLEINDFLGVIEWLEGCDLWDGNVEENDLILKKIRKIDTMLGISRELGKVE